MDFAKIRLPDASKPEKMAWKVLSSVALGTMTNRWKSQQGIAFVLCKTTIQVVGNCGVRSNSGVCMWIFLMPIGRYAETLKLQSRYATCTYSCARPLSMERLIFFKRSSCYVP
jgi:hypothetical protein